MLLAKQRHVYEADIGALHASTLALVHDVSYGNAVLVLIPLLGPDHHLALGIAGANGAELLRGTGNSLVSL